MQCYDEPVRERLIYKRVRDDDNDESDIEEYRAENQWRHEYNNPRTVFSAKEEVNPSFQAKGSRTPIEPTQIHTLRKGDHVGWHRPNGIYWHHAIVCDIEYRKNQIQVIHFKKAKGTLTITKEWLNVYQQKGDFFRFDYSENTCKMNQPESVLKRANARVGETGYHLLKKNCEHFATFCKTGIEDCSQVHWAEGKVKEGAQAIAANVIKSSVKLSCSAVKVAKCGGRLAGAMAKEAGKQGSKGVAESAMKVGGAEVLEHVGNASNWVGAGTVAAIESIHCAYDIYQMNKSKKAGKITDKDFQRCTTQRVSEGVLGGGAAIGGSILGECLGGLIGGAIGSVVPVLGTAIGAYIGAFVGSVAGGAVGSFVGKLVGTVFGNWFGRKLFG